MGLSQKLKIKLMAQPFAIQFCRFRQNKRKKPQNEAKKSMTKRGSTQSSFLRVIQFRGESVQEAFRVNRSKPILPFFVRLQSFSIFKANARRKNCVSITPLFGCKIECPLYISYCFRRYDQKKSEHQNKTEKISVLKL